MTYDSKLDPAPGQDLARNAYNGGSARDWYVLQGADIGAKELPAYGRAMRVHMDAGTSPIVIEMVPINQVADTPVIATTVSVTETLAISARRIVSIDSGTTVPAGVEITMFTS